MSIGSDETIADILAEMREFADTDSQSIGRDVLRRRIQHFARRIEQSVTDCNQFGNAAAMRKALESVRNWCINRLVNAPYQVTVEGILSFVNVGLSVHPRNCDLFDTKDKAREAFQKLRGHRILADVSLWDDRDEIEALFDWLFSKPKGEPK